MTKFSVPELRNWLLDAFKRVEKSKSVGSVGYYLGYDPLYNELVIHVAFRMYDEGATSHPEEYMKEWLKSDDNLQKFLDSLQ